MPTTVLIVAAGAGLRMGRTIPKAFLELDGRPLVYYSLAAFDAHPEVDAVVLMVPGSFMAEARVLAAAHHKVAKVAPGGERRQDTVSLGIDLVAGLTRNGAGASSEPIVLVHDAARPLVDAELITRVIEAARRTGAAFPGVPVSDTLRQTAPDAGRQGGLLAGRTIDRDRLVGVQTPQGFRLSLLIEARARAGGAVVTDEAGLFESFGGKVEVVPGSPGNLKVTCAVDLVVAAALLARSPIQGPRQES